MKYCKIGCLLVLSLVPFWMTSCQTLPNEAGGEIFGVALHHVTGKPVEGVTVALGVVNTLSESEKLVEPYRVDGQQLECTTGRDGTFRFRGVEPGRVLLMTHDDTMAAIESEVALDLGPGEHRRSLEVRVSEGASVSGTIYNDGYYHGVGGVTVQVVPYYEHRPPWLRVYEAVTEADGTFHIGGITGGNYTLRSSPTDGFQETSVSFFGEEPICHPVYFQGFPMAWGAHYANFEFTVAPGAVVRGVVLDEAGHPVPGAEVAHVGSVLSDRIAVLTDDSGQFLYPGWEKPGVPNIMAHKDGLFSKCLLSDKPLAEYGPIQLTLRPGANLRIRVTDENGDNVGWPFDVDIDVTYQGARSSLYERAVEKEPGLFVFPKLPLGTYRLGVRGNHRDYVDSPPDVVTLNPGEDQEITLVAKNTQELFGQEIMGKVVDPDGDVIAGATLESLTSDAYQVSTDLHGTFTYRTRTAKALLSFESPKSLELERIRVSAIGFRSRTIEVKSGETDIEIVLEHVGLIRGRVLDAETGAAIDDYTITPFECRDAADESRSNWRELKSAALTKQPDGHFELTGVAVSPVFLEADTPTHAKASARVAFAPGIEAGTVGFRLQRAGFVRGEVVDARGNPLGKVHVFARAGENVQGEARNDLSGYTMTDAFGRFLIPFESSGSVVLSIGNPHEIHKQTFDVPITGLDGLRIVVPDGLTVRGRVSSGGMPVAGARVLGFRESSTTDAQGYYVLTDVAPGEQEFTCEFSDPDGAPFMRCRTVTFTATPNGPDLNIEMAPAAAMLTGRVANADAESLSRITVEMPRPDGELILESFPAREDGMFQFGPLPEGTAWVVTGRRGNRRGAAVTLRAGETSEVVLDLASGVRIEGTIQRNGIEGPLVVVLLPGDPDLRNYGKTYTTLLIILTGSAPVDGDAFSIDNVAPGKMTLLCWSDAMGQPRPGPPPILGRTTVDVGPNGLAGIQLALSGGEHEDTSH